MRKCGAEAGKESCTIVNMVCIRLMCLNLKKKKVQTPFCFTTLRNVTVPFSVTSPPKFIAGNLCF